jgi:vacuolar-type H+-ATPase catalytic subunit A/Vma1
LQFTGGNVSSKWLNKWQPEMSEEEKQLVLLHERALQTCDKYCYREGADLITQIEQVHLENAIRIKAEVLYQNSYDDDLDISCFAHLQVSFGGVMQQHQQMREDLNGLTTNWNIYSSISNDDETDDNDEEISQCSSQCSTSATIALGDFIDSQKTVMENE